MLSSACSLKGERSLVGVADIPSNKAPSQRYPEEQPALTTTAVNEFHLNPVALLLRSASRGDCVQTSQPSPFFFLLSASEALLPTPAARHNHHIPLRLYPSGFFRIVAVWLKGER